MGLIELTKIKKSSLTGWIDAQKDLREALGESIGILEKIKGGVKKTPRGYSGVFQSPAVIKRLNTLTAELKIVKKDMPRIIAAIEIAGSEAKRPMFSGLRRKFATA